jgi:GNAT superfamily N-acetyltransferase
MPADFSLPAADLALARRLEGVEGATNAASVDSRRALEPAVGATWIEVAGARAMFDGPASPLTQTFGVGVFDAFLDREFAQVEEFFASRGAPTQHEVCSFCDPRTLALLSSRGYTPVEASVVAVRSTQSEGAGPGTIKVRVIDPSESALWCRVAGEAWSHESPELGAFVEQLGAMVSHARGSACFLAEKEGQPIATAALSISNGVALLAGASTIPSARRQGAQAALLEARLAYAAERGAGLAMIVTQPGSASQRNAERRGFRAVYTRAKWMKS